MTELFLQTINMSISAGWLILAVLILRPVLKKAPKWVYVLLWGIVAVRLLFPFSIESTLSLIPSEETIPLDIEMDTTPAIDSGISAINGIINPMVGQFGTPANSTGVNSLQITIAVSAGIWVIGVAVLMSYTMISYRRLRRKVNTAVLYRENIFRSEHILTPFVLGIIGPRIYLPFKMGEQELEHVIAHEQAHIRRKDHWWKPLGFLLLAVHWFNPLMWAAYVLLCRDIELACDETVIRALDSGQRADYTQALLSCSVNRRMITACPLAFGEVGVKERVKSVMNYRKPVFWITVPAVISCVVVAICFLTNPYRPKNDIVRWFDDTDGHPEMNQGNKIQIPEFPGVIFRHSSGEITASKAFDGSDFGGHLIMDAGLPTVLQNAYFCDLNGDGYPELCVSLWAGSGFIDSRVFVHDYANGVSYELVDRTVYDYSLRMNDKKGCLYVDKREYPYDKLVASGRLVLEDGRLRIK